MTKLDILKDILAVLILLSIISASIFSFGPLLLFLAIGLLIGVLCAWSVCRMFDLYVYLREIKK